MENSENKNPKDCLSLIIDVRFIKWGSEIQFQCLNDPVDRKEYILTFRNCREIQWTVHDPDCLQDMEADIINILIGSDNYREAALITTDIFEVSVLYGDFIIQE